MTTTETRYVTDDAGHRIAVLVGLKRYEALLEASEELDAIRAYDKAKSGSSKSVPLEEAIREIELGRTDR